MIGIYKITNLINNHSYVGQSMNISKRWNAHKEEAKKEKSDKFDYPLYRAIRKYGINNFKFEVLEECSINELNEKEIYWINFYKCEYNQTIGGDYSIIPQKLTVEQVNEIKKILISDTEGKISHKELGERYGVSGKDTIRDINVGRTWYDPTLSYPLHHSKYSGFFKKAENYCIDCGKKIYKNSQRCRQCANKERIKNNTSKSIYPNREQLKNLIRIKSFVKIGEQFKVTDNAVRKWCKKYNLPYKVSDIKKYSDAEWELI